MISSNCHHRYLKDYAVCSEDKGIKFFCVLCDKIFEPDWTKTDKQISLETKVSEERIRKYRNKYNLGARLPKDIIKKFTEWDKYDNVYIANLLGLHRQHVYMYRKRNNLPVVSKQLNNIKQRAENGRFK